MSSQFIQITYYNRCRPAYPSIKEKAAPTTPLRKIKARPPSHPTPVRYWWYRSTRTPIHTKITATYNNWNTIKCRRPLSAAVHFATVMTNGEIMLFIDSSKINTLGSTLLKRYRRATAVMAVILLLCALACMLFPIYSGVVISTLTGALMFICGMYSVAMALIFIKYNTRSYISSLLFGIIYFFVIWL